MANRLLTKELVEALKDHQLYSQDGKKQDAICYCVFSIGNITWYILEGQLEGDDFILYGIVVGMGPTPEYGYASLNEMANIKVETGNPFCPFIQIEMVQGFKPQRIGDIEDTRLKSFLAEHYKEIIYNYIKEKSRK